MFHYNPFWGSPMTMKTYTVAGCRGAAVWKSQTFGRGRSSSCGPLRFSHLPMADSWKFETLDVQRDVATGGLWLRYAAMGIQDLGLSWYPNSWIVYFKKHPTKMDDARGVPPILGKLHFKMRNLHWTPVSILTTAFFRGCSKMQGISSKSMFLSTDVFQHTLRVI